MQRFWPRPLSRSCPCNVGSEKFGGFKGEMGCHQNGVKVDEHLQQHSEDRGRLMTRWPRPKKERPDLTGQANDTRTADRRLYTRSNRANPRATRCQRWCRGWRCRIKPSFTRKSQGHLRTSIETQPDRAFERQDSPKLDVLTTSCSGR